MSRKKQKKENEKVITEEAKDVLVSLVIASVVVGVGCNLMQRIENFFASGVRTPQRIVSYEPKHSSNNDFKFDSSPKTPRFQTYIVKYGDTLSEIAQEFGIPMREIIQYNPQIINPDKIYENQKLKIPIK